MTGDLRVALVLVFTVDNSSGMGGEQIADKIKALDPPSHGFGELRVALGDEVGTLLAWLDEVDS